MKISAAIITVVTAFASFASAQQDTNNTSSTDTYDYVIVGGGVAGMYTHAFCYSVNQKKLIIHSL